MKTVKMTVMLGLVLSIVGLARGGEIVVVDDEWGGGGIISCELSIPDGGQWAKSWVVSTAPPGARVTGVSYWVVLSDPWDVLGVVFDCSDYEIGFSSADRGGTSNYFLVWDNEGDATCHAVSLSNSTNVFNGQPVNQTWYFRVKDTFANGKYACFKQLKLNIQYDGAPDSLCCFTLPYEGSVSEPGEAFRVNNTYSGTGRSYGGYFQAAGAEGRGVYGRCTSTVADVNSYGGFFYAAGPKGRGVFGQSAGDQQGIGVKGWASNAADVQNFGGHFSATGMQGIGVYGWAENTGNVQNYGGFFQADGSRGVGVYAVGGPSGYAGQFGGNIKISGSGNGIIFPDGTKQTTAGGGGSAGGFPRPNYDSGWIQLVPGGTKLLVHNLGGNVDNYFVDMQVRDDPPADCVGIHNGNIGGEEPGHLGAGYNSLTDRHIYVWRGLNDTDFYGANSIRIRIWVYE